MRYYTGVGSRSTPTDILTTMTQFAKSIPTWTLRSGHAKGADSAFELGAELIDIYIPIIGFNQGYGNEYQLVTSLSNYQDAYDIAKEIHPAWNHCSRFAKLTHTRNVFQVLGNNLDTPSDLLVCWTPDGAEHESEISPSTGGTATAIALAIQNGVPVFNLNKQPIENVAAYVKSLDY